MVTSTELGYLSGVTSNIQDQLNGKVNVNNHFNTYNNSITSYPSTPGLYRTVGTNIFSSLNYGQANYGVLVILQAIYAIHIYLDCYGNIFWGYSGDTFQEPSTWYSHKSVHYGTSLPSSGSTGCVFFLKST